MDVFNFFGEMMSLTSIAHCLKSPRSWVNFYVIIICAPHSRIEGQYLISVCGSLMGMLAVGNQTVLKMRFENRYLLYCLTFEISTLLSLFIMQSKCLHIACTSPLIYIPLYPAWPFLMQLRLFGGIRSFLAKTSSTKTLNISR